MFNDHEKTVDHPLVMYADIEAILTQHTDNKGEYTTLTHKHIPVAIGSMVIGDPSCRGELHQKYVQFTGREWMSEFIDYLEKICMLIKEWNDEGDYRVAAHRTAEAKRAFDKATRCYMCKYFLIKRRKNFDHDHLTGKYRGAACNVCNRKMFQTRWSMICYFHNYRGYDNNHIVHSLAKRSKWHLTPIAQNMEKFM